MNIFDSDEPTGGALNDDNAFDLLQELEQNKSDEIRRQRAHFRVAVKAKVTLQPANASQMLDFKVQGTTGDLSEGGCQMLFPAPIKVGDIYRLQFDRSELDLPMTFARCVRCRLLREDAFEVGMTFFSPVTMPANLHSMADRSGM